MYLSNKVTNTTITTEQGLLLIKKNEIRSFYLGLYPIPISCNLNQVSLET